MGGRYSPTVVLIELLTSNVQKPFFLEPLAAMGIVGGLIAIAIALELMLRRSNNNNGECQ